MASGRRSHMLKPFGCFRAGPPYARPAPPARSFYAPCLPSKRALFLQITTNGDLLHPLSSTLQASSLPSHHSPNPLLPPQPTHLLPPNLSWLPLSPATPSPWLPLPPSFLPTPATWSHTQHMFPLRGVAGPEGPTWVHVPFSLSDMSQTEEKLGSFSENPARYRREFLKVKLKKKEEFLSLSQAYNLTWSDV